MGLELGDRNDPITGAIASANLFTALGVRAQIGMVFRPTGEGDVPGQLASLFSRTGSGVPPSAEIERS